MMVLIIHMEDRLEEILLNFQKHRYLKNIFHLIPKFLKRFFCNNANSAISRKCWLKYKFDEDITGLEDMELSKRLHGDKGRIAYIAESCVYHIHAESWRQIKRRYERESIAMQRIMPELQISFNDMVRHISAAILSDASKAISKKYFLKRF